MINKNINEDIILNVIKYIGTCKCNINELNIVLQLFPNYNLLRNIINKGISKNNYKIDKIYVEKLNVKNELCLVHDDQIEIDFWTNINKSNLKYIFNKNKYINKKNKYFHDFESPKNFFLHFENSKITSFISNIIEEKYYNIFKMNGYCCNGKGVCLILF
tara:strand:+ start:479 stop:958 length:480 start_codon:yes stop_codon:yes gene_type:complete